MGHYRFRRSIKILPGVRVNLNKKSTSITVGGKGFTRTVSSNGQISNNIGIPGTGISYREIEQPARKSTGPANDSAESNSFAWFIIKFFFISLLILGGLVFVLGLLGSL